MDKIMILTKNAIISATSSSFARGLVLNFAVVMQALGHSLTGTLHPSLNRSAARTAVRQISPLEKNCCRTRAI